MTAPHVPAERRRLLDRLAAEAWPAIEVVERRGWWLRAAAGVTRRANSALPLGAGALTGDALDEQLHAVTGFYADRSLPARVQVSDPLLDTQLAARGWQLESPTLVLSGPPARGESPVAATVTPVPDEAWLACWWAVTGLGGERELDVARRCLAGIASPAGYASVRVDGDVVAVARGVVQEGWLGLFAMAVLPAHRRRGHGRDLLEGLGRWAATQGARAAYLQLGSGNDAGRALYTAAGFETAYSYHYRYRPST